MYLVQVSLFLIVYSYYTVQNHLRRYSSSIHEKRVSIPAPPIIKFFDIFRKDYSKDIFQLYIFSYELNVKSMK
jgi:hypothetical protein